ncbi:hypothetical protein [Micromonospora pisi]|uniref:hypothetical protein n=1 Tax=Micromonospora pisi TaxID=589240 RepID=UPI0011C46925|nr:hypothetical protein [Micromonospora pisi]
MIKAEVGGADRSSAPPPPLEPDVPRWIQLPVRVVATLILVPLGLLWAALRYAGRLLLRYLILPLGWAVDRLLWRPLVWVARNLLWRPLVWVARYLLWLPLVWVARCLLWLPMVWLARQLAWVSVHLLWRPLLWVARQLIWLPLVWLTHHLVLVPLGWLHRQLAPPVRALVRLLVVAAHWSGGQLLRLSGLLWAALAHLGRALVDGVRFGWWVAALVGRFGYRFLLRPVGLALAWLGRHTLVPIGYAVAWLVGRIVALARLIWLGLRYVLRVLISGARFGWWLAVLLGRFVHRFLLRPVGIALRWLWRHSAVPFAAAVRWGWSHGVVPAGRWLRDDVVGPVRVTVRQVLVALGLRRRA